MILKCAEFLILVFVTNLELRLKMNTLIISGFVAVVIHLITIGRARYILIKVDEDPKNEGGLLELKA